MATENKILFIAGEISGDNHGSVLIRELKNLDNSLIFYGVGGDKMQHEGMSIIEHIKNIAFLGFIEVIRHIPSIRRLKRKIIKFVIANDIRTAVLIDYPGFNLNIAKHLKKRGVKVIYYISPQVWAWGKQRVTSIKKYIDKVLVILPFEQEFFKSCGINSTFVGHPLIDALALYKFISKQAFYSEYKLDEGKGILALLPGSRRHEVFDILPQSLKGAKKIADEFGMQIVVACPGSIEKDIFEKYLELYDFTLIQAHTYELLKYAQVGIIKSGTSTLEAALLGLPMVIVYRTNPLTYIIGKNLVSIKNIGLVNIIAGDTIVTELIQKDLKDESVYKEIKKLLENRRYHDSIKTRLNEIKNRLGPGGASVNAAAEIMGVLNGA